MSFFGIRGSRPVVTPFAGLSQDTELDARLHAAIENHKRVSNLTIERSLDTIDKVEEVRVAMQSIVDRIENPGLWTAQGAFDLLSRGNRQNAQQSQHYP